MRSAVPPVMPHDLEAERAVLGAAMLDDELLMEAASIIRTEDFFRSAHRVTFAAMLALQERRVSPDFITLREHLQASGKLSDVGGPAYLTGLTDGIPRSTNVSHYAGIVREKAMRRRMIAAANKLLTSAYESAEPASALLEQAQQALCDVAAHQLVGGGFESTQPLMSEVLAALETNAAHEDELTGIPSGFTALDQMTGGFQPGDLVILAARPSMGKTSLAQAIGVHAATAARCNVGLFSVEMSRMSLGFRLLASEAGVDGSRLRHGRVRTPEWAAVSEAMNRLSDAALHIDDTSDLTVLDVRTRARRLQFEKGLDLLIVDYLQLMRGPDKAENKNLEVAAISRALKIIARDLRVPVIVLSQLSRDVEKRSDKRPILSDLRDSGALEQDADLVLFLHREEYYEPNDDNHGVADLIIAKHRNGPIGTVRLRWVEELTRFENPKSTTAATREAVRARHR